VRFIHIIFCRILLDDLRQPTSSPPFPFISYQVYKIWHIPRNLQHIPAVPFWSYMRSVFADTVQEKGHDLCRFVQKPPKIGMQYDTDMY
jgi:hypothetical protein